MSRSGYQFVSFLVWGIAIAVAAVIWQPLFAWAQRAHPDLSYGVAGAIIAFWLAVVLVLTASLKDRFVKEPVENTSKVMRRRPPEEVVRDAEIALKAGRRSDALLILEQGGLLAEALKLAQESKDRDAMVRLYLKQGYYDRARRIMIDLKDYEGAAQASSLLREVKVARELYKEAAAARENQGANLAELAGLWERAGDVETAAVLHEESGDLVRAAECYDLLENTDKAKWCREAAKTMELYERRKAGLSAEQVEIREAEAKQDLISTAKLLESIGDFFGAAMAYRGADLMVEAGVAFEAFEEWERAARCYEEVSLDDRAALARSRLPKKTPKQEPADQADSSTGDSSASFQGPPPTRAPSPEAIAPQQFIPLSDQAAYLPVFAPQGARTMPSAELQLRVAQRLRRGEFEEAANFALEANDYLMAAALFEQGGNLLRASELYRQIGKINDAIFCLERAGLFRETALLALAMGDAPRAVALLERAINEQNDGDALRLLGEVLIEEKRFPEAIQLLLNRAAPQIVDADSAGVHYRYARLLEANGAQAEAYDIYTRMLKAGVKHEDVWKRQSVLAASLDQPSFAEAPGADPSLHSNRTLILGEGSDSDDEPASAPATIDFELPVDLVPVAGAGGEQVATGARPRSMSLFGAPPPPAPAEEGDLPSFGDVSGGFEMRDATMTRVPGSSASDARPHDLAAVTALSGTGRYEIKRILAQGGMGIVYEAEDKALARPVALKVIHGIAATPEAHQQFLLEARAIARLSHPNVVTIFDIGLLDTKHYITMELVNGKSLQGRIDNEQASGYPLKDALRIFVDMAKGLQAAHETGIVHRDIKPANVLVSDREQVKLVDFGLAKLGAPPGSEDGSDAGRTVFKMSGTPGYMAPEQIDGEESLPRSDIYALGITFFALLVGKPPHLLAGKTKPRQILAFQMGGALPSLRDHRSDVPPAIDEIFKYCTMLDAEERYQSVNQFLPTAEHWLHSVN